jgi:hypothetical protein
LWKKNQKLFIAKSINNIKRLGGDLQAKSKGKQDE